MGKIGHRVIQSGPLNWTAGPHVFLWDSGLVNDDCDGQSKYVLSDPMSVISLPVQLLLCRNLWPIFLVMVIIVTLVVAYAG